MRVEALAQNLEKQLSIWLRPHDGLNLFDRRRNGG